MLRWMWNRGQVSVNQKDPPTQPPTTNLTNQHSHSPKLGGQEARKCKTPLKLQTAKIFISLQADTYLVNYVCNIQIQTFRNTALKVNHLRLFFLFSHNLINHKSSRHQARKRRNCRKRFSLSRKMCSLGSPTNPQTWTGTQC